MEKIIRWGSAIIVTNNAELIGCPKCKDFTDDEYQICSEHFIKINEGKIKVFPQYQITKH